MAAVAGRKRVLSVSPFVPSRDAPYAGHRFYFEYLAKLSELFEVTVLAPGTEDNELFCEQDTPWQAVLAPALPKGVGLRAALGTLSLQGREVPVPQVGGYLRNRVAVPDVVELQWSAAMALAPALRKAFPSAYFAAFQHDRYSATLRWARRRYIGLPGRVRDSLAGWTTAVQERWAASHCDLVAAFKAEDLTFVRGRHKALVIDPWLQPLPARRPNLDRQDVLFVAAFDRKENVTGAIWLLDRVWPIVIARCPRARLVLAGGRPGPDLVARSGPSVFVTGYVEDLGPFYAGAHCCVAPVFAGGGLRFKVPQALLAGIPVVATPEALAGLNGLPPIAGVESSPERFADAVVWALAQQGAAAQQAAAARTWVCERFSFERSVSQVVELYSRATGQVNASSGRQFAAGRERLR